MKSNIFYFPFLKNLNSWWRWRWNKTKGSRFDTPKFTQRVSKLATTGLLLAIFLGCSLWFIGWFFFGWINQRVLNQPNQETPNDQPTNQGIETKVTAYLLMVFKAFQMLGFRGKHLSRNPRFQLLAAEIQDTTWGQQTMRDNHMTLTTRRVGSILAGKSRGTFPPLVTTSKGVAPCRDLPNPTLFSKIKGPKNWKHMERQISTQLCLRLKKTRGT